MEVRAPCVSVASREPARMEPLLRSMLSAGIEMPSVSRSPSTAVYWNVTTAPVEDAYVATASSAPIVIFRLGLPKTVTASLKVTATVIASPLL